MVGLGAAGWRFRARGATRRRRMGARWGGYAQRSPPAHGGRGAGGARHPANAQWLTRRMAGRIGRAPRWFASGPRGRLRGWGWLPGGWRAARGGRRTNGASVARTSVAPSLEPGSPIRARGVATAHRPLVWNPPCRHAPPALGIGIVA